MNNKYYTVFLFTISLTLLLLVGIFFFEKGENLGRAIAVSKTVKVDK